MLGSGSYSMKNQFSPPQRVESEILKDVISNPVNLESGGCTMKKQDFRIKKHDF